MFFFEWRIGQFVEESIYDLVEPASQPAKTALTEQEESIYETQKSSAESAGTANIETNLQNQNFTYFPSEKKVSLESWKFEFGA